MSVEPEMLTWALAARAGVAANAIDAIRAPAINERLTPAPLNLLITVDLLIARPHPRRRLVTPTLTASGWPRQAALARSSQGAS